MTLGILVLLGGVGATGWGLRTASAARRPLDLVGALTALLGMIGVLLGAVATLAPGFFGSP